MRAAHPFTYRDMTDEDRATLRQHLGAKYDGIMLKILHKGHWPTIEEVQYRAKLRRALNTRIHQCNEDGKILVIESGRDCDCVEYSGRTRIIEASIKAFNALEREIGEWADGPFALAVDRPSNEDQHHYESRDLVLEAFEDGHPHHIVSRFA